MSEKYAPPNIESTISILKELEKQASSEPWICKTIQYSNEEIYYELVNGRGKVLLDVLETSNIPEKDLFLIAETRNALDNILDEITRLREDNIRLRELESSLRKHETAGYFLERYYPDIYGEWLEEYRNA